MAKLYDINVHGSFYCAREAAKHMIAKNVQGSIVLIASMSANVGPPSPLFAQFRSLYVHLLDYQHPSTPNSL